MVTGPGLGASDGWWLQCYGLGLGMAGGVVKGLRLGLKARDVWWA